MSNVGVGISRVTLLFAGCAAIAAAAGQPSVIHVADISGAAIQGASVELRSSSGSVIVSAVTDSTGQAFIACQPSAQLRVRTLGFEPQSLNLRDCKPSFDFKLAPAVVHTTIEVVVTNEGEPSVPSGSAAQIERTTARTIFDAVEDLSASVYVTRRGVMGYGIAGNGTGAVSIRGIGGSPNTGVLIVVNGRPDFQGEMGHPLPDFYSLSDAGSISVIEGPASVLYGTNAMGGAVEIRPREPEAGPEFQLTSSLGSYGTGQHRLWAGMRQGRGVYAFSTGINHTDGDRAQSAFRSQDGSLRIGYEISPVWRVSLDGNYGHFLVEDPGRVTAPLPNSYASVGRGGFSADLANTTSQLNGYTRFYSTWGRNFISDGFRSVDRVTGGRVFQTLSLPHEFALDFGTDVVNYGGTARQLDGTDYGGRHEITDAAGFTRARWAPSVRLLLNAGFRYQTDSVFGNIAVPEFGAVWQAASRISISGSASRGFRNPTIRELYLFPAPNPNLQPETLWNYQTTIQTRLPGNVTAWATFFYANLTNQIITLGQYPNLQLSNSGKAINKGIETNLRWALSRRVRTSLGYAHLASTNLAPLIPQNKANAAVDFDLRRVFVHLGVQAIGKRFSSASHASQLGGYTLASVKISFPVKRNLDVFAVADNVLNHRYEVLPGYPMPGLNAAAGFTIHFR